jgi:hypothetical protein
VGTAGIIAASTIGAAGIGAVGSGLASSAQAGAAKTAAQTQLELGQESLDFQKQQFQTEQQNLAPWLNAGTGGINELAYLLGITPQTPTGGTAATLGLGNPQTGGSPPILGPPGQRTAENIRVGNQLRGTPIVGGTQGTPATGAPSGINPQLGAFGSLMQPWTQTFQAPTAEQAAQYPGYQFQLQQGLNAMQNSQAAQGNLISGGSQAALNNYAQGAAQSDYNNVYNQALNQYTLGYNQFQQNQANQFNRLAALSGIGQTAAQTLGGLGQQAAGNVANINLGTGGQVGNSLINQGAATASGYAGVSNALGGGLNSIGQIALLSQLLGGGSSGQNPLWALGTPGTNPS